MALFGDLQHHALADLARVTHTFTGTPVFRSCYPGQTLELVLKTGQLRTLYLAGVPIETLPEARDVLGRLPAQGHGAFEFRPQKTADGQRAARHQRQARLQPLLNALLVRPHPEPWGRCADRPSDR